MPAKTLSRGGTYYGVAKPEWSDPLDTSHAKRHGRRWNPPGEFGALYLSRTIEVAAANARWQHRGRAIGRFDLRPERRPVLVTLELLGSRLLDVVTAAGVASVGFPARYPFGVSYERCQPKGRRAYHDGLAGVACRSAAECTPKEWLGEELTWFDRSLGVRESAKRRAFADWYPDVVPDARSVGPR